MTYYIKHHHPGYTCGGLPENQAATWNTETNQRLGSIIFRLYSEKKNDRIAAYADFYDMRRLFMRDPWNEQLKKLDEHRISKGAPTLESMLEKVDRELCPSRYEDCTTDKPIIEEVPTTTKQEVVMSGLKKICEGLKMAGEGLIELSSEMVVMNKALDGLLERSVHAVRQLEALVSEKPIASKAKPAAKVEVVEEAIEEAIEEEVEEKPVDFKALREECIRKGLELSKKNRDALIEISKQFEGKKISAVSDEQLEGVLEALNEALGA
jgi:hypothetical protein